MKYTKSAETIYTTTDYDGFVFTDWNRDVSNARVVKMVESIKKVGWLPEPVMVNEKFEVIDGQSRVKALEKLGMPVQFCIRKGVGRKECQALNLFQKNWTTRDYINSYIADGNDNYIWLKDMLEKYSALTPQIVQSCVASKGKAKHMNGGAITYKITSGTLKLNFFERTYVEDELFYLSRFTNINRVVGGRKDVFYAALVFIYRLDGIDKERVCKVLNNACYDGIVASGTIEGWLQQIESLYNSRLKKRNQYDLMHEYKVAA